MVSPLLLNLHVWRISSWCYLLFSVFNCISSHQVCYLVTSFEIIYVVHQHKHAWAQVVIQDSICGLYVLAHPSFCPSKPFILSPPIERLWYSPWGILYALAMMVGFTISTVWMSRLGPCAIESPNKLCDSQGMWTVIYLDLRVSVHESGLTHLVSFWTSVVFPGHRTNQVSGPTHLLIVCGPSKNLWLKPVGFSRSTSGFSLSFCPLAIEQGPVRPSR